jgi:hypothetical protein
MKKLFILLLFFNFHDLQAKFIPLRLADLIDKADLIVHGEITASQGNSLDAKILQVIKGTSVSAPIRIDKFEDWTCANRFASYQVGQQEVFFLKRNQATGRYTVLGAGDEGEMPMMKSKVYYKQQYLTVDKSPTLFKVYGGALSGYAYDKSELIAAIKFYALHRSEIQSGVVPTQYAASVTKNTALARIIAELHR